MNKEVLKEDELSGRLYYGKPETPKRKVELDWRATQEGRDLIATYGGKIIGCSALKQKLGSAIMISTIDGKVVDGYALQHHVPDEEIERRLTQECNRMIEKLEEKSTPQTFGKKFIAKIPLVIGGYNDKRKSMQNLQYNI